MFLFFPLLWSNELGATKCYCAFTQHLPDICGNWNDSICPLKMYAAHHFIFQERSYCPHCFHLPMTYLRCYTFHCLLLSHTMKFYCGSVSLVIYLMMYIFFLLKTDYTDLRVKCYNNLCIDISNQIAVDNSSDTSQEIYGESKCNNCNNNVKRSLILSNYSSLSLSPVDLEFYS